MLGILDDSALAYLAHIALPLGSIWPGNAWAIPGKRMEENSIAKSDIRA